MLLAVVDRCALYACLLGRGEDDSGLGKGVKECCLLVLCGSRFLGCEGAAWWSVGGRSVPLLLVTLLNEVGFTDAVSPGKLAQRRPRFILAPYCLPVCHRSPTQCMTTHIVSIA